MRERARLAREGGDHVFGLDHVGLAGKDALGEEVVDFRVGVGAAVLDDEEPTRAPRMHRSPAALEATPPALPAGSYTVEWRGLSEDGHAMSGRFSFEVRP